MTSRALLVLISLTLAVSIVAHDNNPSAPGAAPCTNKLGPWIRMKTGPQIHQEGQPTAVISQKLWVLGAFGDDDLEITTAISVFDPQANSWQTLDVRTPFNASHVNCAYDDRFMFMVAGFAGKHPGTATKLCFLFDTRTHVFTSLPDLPEVRASGSTFLERTPDNMVYFLHYVGGLVDRNQNSDAHFVLELHREGLGAKQTFAAVGGWERSVPMPMARNHAATILIDDTLYISGGQFGHDANPQDQKLMHSYHLPSQTWERLADLPRARSHVEPATINVNGRILVFGGRYDAYPRHDDYLEYNIDFNSWVNMGKLPDGEHINYSAGLFRSITIKPNASLELTGDFVVLTVGGKDWNIGTTDTFMALVQPFACGTPPVEPPPFDPPTDEPKASPVPLPAPEAPVAPVAPLDDRNVPTAPTPEFSGSAEAEMFACTSVLLITALFLLL